MEWRVIPQSVRLELVVIPIREVEERRQINKCLVPLRNEIPKLPVRNGVPFAIWHFVVLERQSPQIQCQEIDSYEYQRLCLIPVYFHAIMSNNEIYKYCHKV